MHFPGAIRCGVHLLLAAACLGPAAGWAQTDDLATFGTTVVVPGGLTGKIYFLRPNTWVLPNFEKLEPVGTIYAKGLNISRRDFRVGFPGITDRVEWFAIDFTGRFYISQPGDYEFNVESDDGSKLYIDQRIAIDNDGDHSTFARNAVVKLEGGIHSIRLSYFQGPGYELSLILSVSGPGDRRLRPFNTDNFKPPSNPDEWKYGNPDQWKESPDPRLLRRARTGELVRAPVEVVSRDKPVRGLKRSDFLLLDNREPKEIAGAEFGGQVFDLILLIENTPGMRPFNSRIGDAARRALTRLDHRDHVAVVFFGESPVLAMGFSNRPDKLTNAVASGPANPRGAGLAELNGAIISAARYLEQNARPEATRAIVAITLNNGRRQVSDGATRDELWRANVTLSAVVPKEAPMAGPAARRAGPDAADIRPLIEAAGGDLLVMDRNSMPLSEAFDRLRERYLIAFPSAEGPANLIRNIGVDLIPETKARLQDLKIRARGGYAIEER